MQKKQGLIYGISFQVWRAGLKTLTSLMWPAGRSLPMPALARHSVFQFHVLLSPDEGTVLPFTPVSYEMLEGNVPLW